MKRKKLTFVPEQKNKRKLLARYPTAGELKEVHAMLNTLQDWLTSQQQAATRALAEQEERFARFYKSFPCQELTVCHVEEMARLRGKLEAVEEVIQRIESDRKFLDEMFHKLKAA